MKAREREREKRDFSKQLQRATILMKALDIELLHCCMIRDLITRLWGKSIILLHSPPQCRNKTVSFCNAYETTHLSVTITYHNSTRSWAVMTPHSMIPLQAFSGTVVEKDPMPTTVPHLTISPPALPTIMERRQEEVAPDAAPPPQQAPKRVSKFKAARMQQKWL